MEKIMPIRINDELKEKLILKAKRLGLSLSSFVRMTLIKEVSE